MGRTQAVVNDPSFLTAALEGLELQKHRLEEQIRQVKALLGRRRVTPSPMMPVALVEKAPRKRRVLSVAARKRIAAAQKKRWAEFHKKKASE